MTANRSGQFDAFAAGTTINADALVTGEWMDARVASVSAEFFDLSGVRPEIGRLFSSEEDQRGRDPVALIDDEVWRSKFGRPFRRGDATRELGEGTAAHARGQGFRNALATQIAVAMILLSGAGLMTNTLLRLWNVDLGFTPATVLEISPAFPSWPAGDWDSVVKKIRRCGRNFCAKRPSAFAASPE